MRVVLDTNVLVSTYLSRAGTIRDLAQAWQAGAFVLLVSEPLLEEYRRVLNYPHLTQRHRKSPAEINADILRIRRTALLVEPGQTLSVIAVDPTDNRFLERAQAGQADLIVSGDRHLLDLGSYEGISIVTPTAFLKVLASG